MGPCLGFVCCLLCRGHLWGRGVVAGVTIDCAGSSPRSSRIMHHNPTPKALHFKSSLCAGGVWSDGGSGRLPGLLGGCEWGGGSQLDVPCVHAPQRERRPVPRTAPPTPKLTCDEVELDVPAVLWREMVHGIGLIHGT